MSAEQWSTPLMQILTRHGIDAKEVTLTPLSGGSISPVWKAGTAEGDYLVKIGEVPVMLEKEAKGRKQQLIFADVNGAYRFTEPISKSEVGSFDQ
ncbi:hypothetical protein ABDI30_23605 [Paenibacillus cisolokensis]|uniref:hypothetical protein n=1 Tax=Paenibacillus cisolokensis TaxID=1658519 RepID=UPI003D26C3BB